MTKKILCAVDDCEHSKVAARLAGALAAGLGADLTLLAVNELIGGYIRSEASARIWSTPQKRKLLDEAAVEAIAAGAEKVETAIAESRDVARAIAQYAEEHGYDHIVIGSGGEERRQAHGARFRILRCREPCIMLGDGAR